MKNFVALLSLLLVSVSYANAAHANDCEHLLIKPAETSIDETAILAEEHSLLSLLHADPEKNLAVKHPSIAMNSWQRLASWILSAGVRSAPHPEYGAGNINVYPIFSDGLPEAGGKRIIDQHDAIQVLVDYVLAGARGDGSKSKMILFNGPPGTGKTEFLTILGKISEYLTAAKPEHFMYTYEWHGLKDISELQPVLNLQIDDGGNQYEHPITCPLNESPFALLPSGYQQNVLEMVKPTAEKLAKALPTPSRKLCPHCLHIREALIRDHIKRHPGVKMTQEAVVKLLNAHVKIKRVVVGKGGTLPKINAEGKDVDYAGLFGSPNAFVLNTFGTKHPFSYTLDGKVLRANGQMLMLDEFFRNMPELRDVFLEVIENGDVVRGGAPKIALDAVIVGASNDASIENAKSNAGAIAHLDRVRREPMRYQLAPHSIAKTVVLMKGIERFIIQKLSSVKPAGEHQGEEVSTEAEMPPFQPGNLDELFPETVHGQPRLGPDHRYNVWIRTAPDAAPVHISPHTLMYISTVVGASRVSMNEKKAKEYMPNAKIIHSNVFSSVATRMRYLMRMGEPVSGAEASELQELSAYLEEGTFGISARDAANIWLTAAIAEAQLPQNGGCLTPILAMKTFKRLLSKKVIEAPNNQTRLQWLNYSQIMMGEFVIKGIAQDVQTAIGSGMGAINSVYDEVFNELLALQADENATTYQTSTEETRPINKERLLEIRGIYALTQGRTFSPGEVIVAHASPAGKKSDRRHEGLKAAIGHYLSKRVTDLLNFEDLTRFAQSNEGNAEVREKFTDLSRLMHHELGYCPRCMKAALVLAKQHNSGRAQQEGVH